MNRAWPHIAVAMLAANIVLLGGCAGGGPFGWLGGNRVASQPYQRTGSPFASAGVGQKPTPPTAGQAIYSAFKNSSERLSNAFAGKPKTVEADDPIGLSNKPDKISVDVFNQAAQIHETQGNADAAITQYEKALEVEPQNLKALLGLARLHDRQEDFAGATKLYLRALEAHPNHAIVLNDLGLCYARQREIESSVDALQRAVAADPKSQLYRNNLAMVLIEQDRYEEALRHFTAAHGEAVAHFNLGFLLLKKGRQDLAVHNLERALKYDPQMDGARQLLAQLEPANAAAAYQAQNPAPADRQPATDDSAHVAPVVTPSQVQAGGPSQVQAGGEFPPVRLPDMSASHQPGQLAEAKSPPLPGQTGDAGEAISYFAEPRHLPPVE